MAHTQPFFRHTAQPTGIRPPAPAPERYPFHDDDECPVGQEVKASGEWQCYEPRRKEETRPRCLACARLQQDGARPASFRQLKS